MAWQQASVCLLVSFLFVVVRGYGLYPGTLPDRLYRGFRIGFRHLYPGNGDEDINKVIDEESGDDDERNLLEKVETIKEIPHHHHQNHRIIEEVSRHL